MQQIVFFFNHWGRDWNDENDRVSFSLKTSNESERETESPRPTSNET